MAKAILENLNKKGLTIAEQNYLLKSALEAPTPQIAGKFLDRLKQSFSSAQPKSLGGAFEFAQAAKLASKGEVIKEYSRNIIVSYQNVIFVNGKPMPGSSVTNSYDLDIVTIAGQAIETKSSVTNLSKILEQMQKLQAVITNSNSDIMSGRVIIGYVKPELRPMIENWKASQNMTKIVLEFLDLKSPPP